MAEETKLTGKEVTSSPPPAKRTVPNIVASEGPVLAIVPRTLSEALEFARVVIAANLAPESLTHEKGKPLPPDMIMSRVVAVILGGCEIGLAPMHALQTLALINGRLHLWGSGVVALVQASGQLEWRKREEIGTVPDAKTPTAKFSEDYGVRVLMKRRGQDDPYVGEYTVGDAMRGHLWMNTNKKPWIEHPKRQLFWRAFQVAAHDGFDDFLHGIGIRELAGDEPVAPLPAPVVDTSFLDSPTPAAVVP